MIHKEAEEERSDVGYVVTGRAGTKIRFTRLLSHALDVDSDCFSFNLRTTGLPENINKLFILATSLDHFTAGLTIA